MIKSKGFDHVRLPLGLAVNTNSNHIINADYLQKLDRAVNLALNSDLSVVLDMHGCGNLNGDVSANRDKFISIWEQMAIHYRDYSSRVVFELINEPNTDDSGVDPLTAEKLIALQEETVKKIRETNPTRLIAVTVLENSGTWMLSRSPFNTEFVCPGDPNIIVSVHNYSDMSFTHQGADWIRDSSGNLVFPGGLALPDSTKTAMESALNTCAAYESSNNRQVWLSEFGVYLGGGVKQADVTAYYDAVTKYANNNGIGWCMWEFCEGFGAYDVHTSSWRSYVLAGLNFCKY